MWIYHLLHQLGCRYIHILYITLSITLYIPYFHVFLTMFFPPWSSTTGTFLSKRGSTISFCPCNENSAYVQSIVHQQSRESRSEQIWQLSEILKRSIWKTMKNLKRSWKTEYFPRSQPNRRPSLACRALIVHLWDMPPGGPEIPRSTQHATGTQQMQQESAQHHSMPSSTLLSDPTTTIHETQPGQPKHILRLRSWCLTNFETWFRFKKTEVHLKYIQSRHKNYGSLNMSQGLGLFMTPSRIQATISAPPCHARRPCKCCESTRRHNTTHVQRKVLMSSPACTACGAWCTCDTKWHEFAFWIFHCVQAPASHIRHLFLH